jgi:hypothetical protein
MEVFDLRWPKTSATLCTDGWRCRVVWRTPNGMGGVIDNTELAKKRIAGGLDCTPELLDDLRASGHVHLAAEIESLADPLDLAPQASDEPLLWRWLEALCGSDDWAACGTRRAKVWTCVARAECGTVADRWTEELYLKAPGANGKKEWVLKRVWSDPTPDGEKIAPQYVTAKDLKGIFTYLAGIAEHEHDGFFGNVVDGLAPLADALPEVRDVTLAWEKVSSPLH